RRGDASLLGVKQREPEQDQRAGNAGRYMQGLARGRGVGEEDLGANQRLVDAEVEAEQILGHDGEPQDNEGKADHSRERTERPEGEAERPIASGATPTTAWGVTLG